MNFTEECLPFECEGEPLVAILARPERPSRVGLLIIVGGPQYRVGSHRQFVLLARHLAASGHAVLRFDYRGMGDGGGDVRDFSSATLDIDAAIATLRHAVPEAERVALWGLCDGASASLLYLLDRPRAGVAGLCLLNPWVRSAQSQAIAQVKHYYTQRLMERGFWLKLLRGKVGLGRLAELWASVRTMVARRPRDATVSLSFQKRMATAWQRDEGQVLLVLSGRDLTAKEFLEVAATDPDWNGVMTHPQLTRLDLPEADHTFSDPAAARMVEQATCDWLDRLTRGAAAPVVGHAA